MPGFTGEGYVIFDPVTGGGAYKITGGANGSWAQLLDLVQKIISYIGAFGSLVKGWLGPLGDTINALIDIMVALWNCPSPHAQFIVGLTIAFLISGLLLGFVITLAFGLIAGLFASFIFGAIMQQWLSQYRKFRCGV